MTAILTEESPDRAEVVCRRRRRRCLPRAHRPS